MTDNQFIGAMLLATFVAIIIIAAYVDATYPTTHATTPVTAHCL